jgi:pyridoxine 4-dehydrogenase
MNTTTFLGDKPINRMGYGAMQLAGPGVFGPPRDPGAAQAVLRRAIELGVDHIDTSQYYGPDVVNDLIRQTLHPYPENLKLVIKVGARRGRRRTGASRAAARRATRRGRGEPPLTRVERLDLVNLRLVEARHDTAVPLEEQLAELEDMRPVMRMRSVPDIEVLLIDSTEPPTGVGEVSVPMVAPALANAIAALTGTRIRELPFSKTIKI